MQMIDLKKFAATALVLNKKAFVVHMAYLVAKILIHPIQKAQITLLLHQKISVMNEYTDFSDIFSQKSTAVLPNYLDINKHVIDQKPGKQLSYK